MMTGIDLPKERRRRPKHMDEKGKKGITGLLFPDLYAKHMVVDK